MPLPILASGGVTPRQMTGVGHRTGGFTPPAHQIREGHLPRDAPPGARALSSRMRQRQLSRSFRHALNPSLERVMLFYAVLADVLTAIHGAYVGFVVLGELAILVGAAFGCRWARNPWFRSLHLLAIA